MISLLKGCKSRPSNSKKTASGWDNLIDGVFAPAHAKSRSQLSTKSASERNFVKLHLRKGRGGYRKGARAKYSDRYKRRNHRNFRSRNNTCFKCGRKGHIAAECPSSVPSDCDSDEVVADPTVRINDSESTSTINQCSFEDESKRFGMSDRLDKEAEFEQAAKTAAAAAAAEKGEYELEREAQIRKNEEMLAALGILPPITQTNQIVQSSATDSTDVGSLHVEQRSTSKDRCDKSNSPSECSVDERQRAALANKTVIDLKHLLRERGLPISGRKSNLVSRLLAAPQHQPPPAVSVPRLSEPSLSSAGEISDSEWERIAEMCTSDGVDNGSGTEFSNLSESVDAGTAPSTKSLSLPATVTSKEGLLMALKELCGYAGWRFTFNRALHYCRVMNLPP